MKGLFPVAFPAPLRTVFEIPVDRCQIESDVVAHLLGLKPLMPQDFLVRRVELSVQEGFLEQFLSQAQRFGTGG